MAMAEWCKHCCTTGVARNVLVHMHAHALTYTIALTMIVACMTTEVVTQRRQLQNSTGMLGLQSSSSQLLTLYLLDQEEVRNASSFKSLREKLWSVLQANGNIILADI